MPTAIDELFEIASEFSLLDGLQKARPCLYVCDDPFFDWFSARASALPDLQLARLSRPGRTGADDLPWILCTLGDELSQLAELRRQYPAPTVLGLLYDVLPRCISNLPVRRARRTADRRYMVLSVPRSGSYYLCGLLEGAGFGAAREHLRTPVCELARQGRIILGDWIENLASCLSVNGWLGTKLISHYLFEALDSGLPAEAFVRHVVAADYRVVRIVRRDKVQQAVSNYFGRSTEIWTRGRHDAMPERPGYDFGELMSDYEFLHQQEEWLQRAVEHLPRVHTVHYEDLVEDVDGTMGRVCEHLGETWKPGVQPRTHRQRDDYSLEMATRFAQDLERRG